MVVMHSNFQHAEPHAVEASTLSCLTFNYNQNSHIIAFREWQLHPRSHMHSDSYLLHIEIAGRKLLIVSIVLMTIVREHTVR